MSYILDALKKADAQRGEGAVPGIHDQHMPPDFSQGASSGNPLLIWIIMAMGVVLIGVLVWAMVRNEDTPVTPPMPVSVATPSPVVVAPVPVAVNPVPSPVVALPPSTQAAPARAERKPSRAAPLDPALRTDDTPSLMPAAMLAQWPKLVFGGAMYSDNPASRMLIINGQLFHEGDQVSTDLVLEQIQLKSATFRFKGHHHTVQY